MSFSRVPNRLPQARTPYISTSGSRPTTTARLPPDHNILEGLATTPLQKISKPPQSGDGEIKIKDLKYIGSYNWLDGTEPSIIVPGSPPEWTNKAPPFQVKPDSGLTYIDQNTYRSPASSLMPLVRVVEIEAPDFDWSAVDLVTDRNGLRKLLRWIRDPQAREFRIDTQLAGEKTVLFSRWEKRSAESLDDRVKPNGRTYQTYGFSFEKASTKPAAGCAGSTGYHRIVEYDFSGLRVVVRFEVDACIPQPQAKSPAKPNPKADVDSLADAFGGISLSAAVDTPEKDEFGLRVRHAGSHVPQSNLVELSTISEWSRANRFDWTESYPQLFLSQTRHHFLAMHENGRFSNVEKRKLGTADFAEASRDLQGALWGLRKALDAIRRVVLKHGRDGRLSLVCQNGELSVYERDSAASCLPDSLLEKFDL